MKQKLIALLKTSFASKGFNAKELESLADLIISQQSLTDDSADEDLNTAVTNAKPVADFVQSVASRQVSDVKKPAKVEEPAKPADPAKPANPATIPDDMPEWAKALVTSVQTLGQGLQAISTEKLANTRREKYEKTLEGLTEAQKADKLADFELLTFKDDDHFNTWNESKAESVKVIVQENTNNSLGGERPAGGTGGGNASAKKLASDVELDAVMENL